LLLLDVRVGCAARHGSNSDGAIGSGGLVEELEERERCAADDG
jgi:hypothetical protein